MISAVCHDDALRGRAPWDALRELSGSLDTKPAHCKQVLTADQAGNMDIDAIAAIGGTYLHALIAVATVVATSVFIYIRRRQLLRELEKITPNLELVVKRRVQILHLLVTRLAATSESVTKKELQKLILSAGHSPDHSDSIFALRELTCSPAVDASKGCLKFAVNHSLQRDVWGSALPASQTWQSKEDLQLYLKEVIVSMADVTGMNEVSVAYALQSNMGSLVGALKDIITSTEPWCLSPSAQQQPESLVLVCPLQMSDECNDNSCHTFLTCPSCGFVVCTACHLASVLDTDRFTMLDDHPTRPRFEHEGFHQSLSFFCCVNPTCGVLLPPRTWNAFKADVASPRSKKLPDTLLSQCARLVSRVCRHSARPLIVSCVCSNFYWRSSPFQPAICECGKSSLEYLSVQENQKWALEMEQYLVDKKNAPVASHQGVEPSAVYKAFAKAGCSNEFLREYARVQERFKKKVETLADGRQISLDFEHLPQLNESARIFTENGSTFSVSSSSKHASYSVKLSTECRDALRFNESGPLAMIENGNLQFVANRMCPMCYCGPVAESECGNILTHQGQHISKGQNDGVLGHRAVQTHIIDNSCRRCQFLGENVREYPLYDPVVAEGAGMSERAGRDTAVLAVSEGFDECISKLPAIVRAFSELRLERVKPRRREKCDSLGISSLPPEALGSMLRCARTAVIRRHLSNMTPSRNEDSSFERILWRAIECSEKTSGAFSKGWPDIRQQWIQSCFGSYRLIIPNTTLLETTTLFAAVVGPLVMQEFSSQERALFASGSFASTPRVWDRLIEASQMPLQFANNAAQSSSPFSDHAPWFDFVVVGLLEIAFGFVIFTAYSIVAYWPCRLAAMLLDPFMIRVFYSVMLSWIFVGAFISNLSIMQFPCGYKRYKRHLKIVMLMLLKYLGCGVSLACAICLVHDFAFSVPMLLLAHSPLWFCAGHCAPLVACSRAKMFFAILPKVWFQQRSIRQMFDECLQTLFKLPVHLLDIIKTCTCYLLRSNGVFHFGILCLCIFVDHTALEPGFLQPTPNWMHIVKISQRVFYCELAHLAADAYYYFWDDGEEEDNAKRFFNFLVLSPMSSAVIILGAHLLLVPIYLLLSNGTVSNGTAMGDIYWGKYHDNGTESKQTIPYLAFLPELDPFNHTRSGIGLQKWHNGDWYAGAWRDNNMNGKGKYRWVNGEVYEGDWIDGKRSGHGIQTWPGGEVYQGQWSNHKRNGKGNLTLPNISVYEGEFADDQYHGLGIISFTDGRVFKGEFRNGVFDEQGNVTLPNITPHVPVRFPVEWFGFIAISYAILYFIGFFYVLFGLFFCLLFVAGFFGTFSSFFH